MTNRVSHAPNQAWLDSPVDHVFVSSWLDDSHVREFIGDSFDVEKLPRGVNNKWAKAVYEQFDALPKGEEVSLSTRFASVLSGKNSELIQFLSAAGLESPIAKDRELRFVLEVIKEREELREDLIKTFSTHIHIFLRMIAEDKMMKERGMNEFAKASLLEKTKKFMDIFFLKANFKPKDANELFLFVVKNNEDEVIQIFLDKNLDKETFDQKTIGEAFVSAARTFIDVNLKKEDMEKIKKTIEILLRRLPPDDINISNIFAEAAEKGNLKLMNFLFNFDNGSFVKYIDINKALIKAANASKLERMTFLFEDGMRVKIFNDININRIFVKAARAGYFVDSTSDRWFIRDFLSVGPNAKITDETISNVLKQAIKEGFFEIAIDLLEAGSRPGINFSIDDAIQEVTGEEGVRQGHRGGPSASDMIHYILAKWPCMDMSMEIPDTDL